MCQPHDFGFLVLTFELDNTLSVVLHREYIPLVPYSCFLVYPDLETVQKSKHLKTGLFQLV